MVILQRLLAAGADERMWLSQYGFRRGRNTEQALHCARRAIDFASATRNGSLHMLALDSRKAFDSIAPEAMLKALRRFGLPQHCLEVVTSIYTDRKFIVRECGVESSPGAQGAGVCQGCPLSPFLLGIVMTVLMTDAYTTLPAAAQEEVDHNRLYDILYADAALLLGVSPTHVGSSAAAVEAGGAQ